MQGLCGSLELAGDLAALRANRALAAADMRVLRGLTVWLALGRVRVDVELPLLLVALSTLGKEGGGGRDGGCGGWVSAEGGGGWRVGVWGWRS